MPENDAKSADPVKSALSGKAGTTGTAGTAGRAAKVTRRDYISPRQLAAALGVSESSIKRWCDQGVLRATRTTGGHRRVTLADVWDFLRQSNRTLKDPTVLGLPEVGATSPRTVQTASDDLASVLESGDEPSAHRIVFDQYLVARRPLGVLMDEVIAPAFRKIGDDWECGDTEVYQERRACDIALRMLDRLGELIHVPTGAPIAIGGTFEGDQYQIPTRMVELVLRDQGWQATSLGSNLPTTTLQAAVSQLKPQLIWLSCSHIADEGHFRREFEQLWSSAKQVNASLLTGGRALEPKLLENLPFAHHCANMRHLYQLSAELHRLYVDAPDSL